MPLVTLCAKRAASSFAETWVAISDHASDDLLANYALEVIYPMF